MRLRYEISSKNWKIESLGYPTVKPHDLTVIGFDSVPACAGQTDGQTVCTDGQTDMPLMAKSRIMD